MTAAKLDKLYVRVFSERPGRLPLGARPERKRLNTPSPRLLVLDCETTTDASQRLRFGWCQQWDGEAFLGEGLFYALDLPPDDVAILELVAAETGATLVTVEELRRDAILGWAFDGNATIVGFNLPFDIARIAVRSSPARGHMRGGFTHRMSDDDFAACIRTKHLSASMSLIDFAQPRKNVTPGSMRKAWEDDDSDDEESDFLIPANRGYFVDVKTLAASQLPGRHTLASLTAFLKTPTLKIERDDHGAAITREYVLYGRDDVKATLECYRALVAMYERHQLPREPHQILSEASIGKGYLEAMGVRPFFAFQNSEPRASLGRNMSSYYGGRAESGVRREPTQVMYCDFKSMYPTCNGLMGSTRFVMAQGYSEEETTAATQAFLDSATLDHLLRPDIWRQMPTIAQLKPDDDLLPARMRYSPVHKNLKRPPNNFTIGLNHITSGMPLWYMLPDVLASKVLTGRTPRILKAITFHPGPMQEGLQPFQLFGREEYAIDPRTDDLFVRLIDMRDEARAKRDPLEKVMKIIANATCYGIYAEIQRDDVSKPKPISVHGPESVAFDTQSLAIEEPGEFFHPVLAPLITSAARLMLALAERLARDEGLSWVFCDTDSIAMARPEGMKEGEFYARCQRVIDQFNSLNPYRASGSILKAEDHNFKAGTKPEDGQIQALYCLSISAKRYALFNIDEAGRPIIRKFSAHGLGHLMEPYGDDTPASDTPEPIAPVRDLGGRRWQYDFWYRIITAALAGKPNQVDRSYHPKLSAPAMIRYGATSPAMLRWMKKHNAKQSSYAEQVKPYGFMVGFLAREGGAFADDWEAVPIDSVKAGRPFAAQIPAPVAPFERDPEKAVEGAFDRTTGKKVQASEFLTYREALAKYHVSPEDKFENGGPADTGPTIRRHLHITKIGLIGKEANKIGDAGEEDGESEAVVEFTS